MTQPADTGILVRATQMGFYGGCRIKPGMTFTIAHESEFSQKWMVRVHDPNVGDDLEAARQAARQTVRKLRAPDGVDAALLTTPTTAGAKQPTSPAPQGTTQTDVVQPGTRRSRQRPRTTREQDLKAYPQRVTKALEEHRFRLVKSYRDEHGLSVDDLEKRLGMSRSTLYGAIHETPRKCNVRKRNAILEKLGIPVERWYRR